MSKRLRLSINTPQSDESLYPLKRPVLIRTRNPKNLGNLCIQVVKTRGKSILQVRGEQDHSFFEGKSTSHDLASGQSSVLLARIDEKQGIISLWKPEIITGETTIKRQEDKEDSHTKSNVGSEYLQSRVLLGESFGTRLKKRMLSSVDRNKINMEELSGHADYLNKNINIPSNSADSQVTNAVSSFSIELKCSFKDLVPGPVFDALGAKSVVEAFREYNSDVNRFMENIGPLGLEKTIAIRLVNVIKSSSKLNEKTVNQLKGLLYLNLLLRFRSLNETQVNGDLGLKMGISSGEITKHLLESYTEVVPSKTGKPRYCLSSMAKDRLITKFATILLILNEKQVQVQELSEALKLPKKKCIDYLKVLGCSFDGNRATAFIK